MNHFADTAHPDAIFSIELTNGVQAIKEIYYEKGRGSILTYGPTKDLLLATLTFMLLSGLFYLLSFSDQIAWIVLFYLSVLAFFGFLLAFSFRAEKYFKWKKSVKTYLKELSKYERHSFN